MLEVEDEESQDPAQNQDPSHRRPCPPLYSGRAGYNLETLEGEKTSWPLVVRLRYQLDITRNGYLPALALFLVDVCSFAILSFPGLLCRSEQSRMPLLPFVCSFTCWHVPARSSHAPGTRPGKPRRIRHKLFGVLLCGFMPAGHPPWQSMSVRPLGHTWG